MTEEDYIAKSRYLTKNIFYGLEDLNNGFDVKSISYFNEAQFALVIERIKSSNAIGIYGIEPHWFNPETQEIEYWGVDTFENYNTIPQDPTWYTAAFERFKATGVQLLYSASYYVPGNYLDFSKNESA